MSQQDFARFDGQPPGVIIRTLREERGWNQKELADRVGRIDRAGVSKIETGATNLGAERAERFALALGVPTSLLLPVSRLQPTNQDLADRLESLEDALRVVTENQERLTALVEHLAVPEQRADEHE